MSSIGPAGLGPVLAVTWAALLLGVAAPRTQAQEAAAAEAAAPGTPPEAAPEAASRLPMVTVATAAMRELTLRVAVSGTLVARERVQVYPQVEGAVITELLADVGDRVEEGQLLVQLDDRALRSRLAQAEAERARAEAGLGQADNQIASAEATLEQAGQAFARARSLRESGTATQAALDDAQAALRTAEAGLRSAEDGAAVAAAALRQAEASLELAQLDLAKEPHWKVGTNQLRLLVSNQPQKRQSAPVRLRQSSACRNAQPGKRARRWPPLHPLASGW